MVNSDLILKFENTTEAPLMIVIDPPCTDYTVEPGQNLKLKIVGYRDISEDVSNIVDVRYSNQNVINIDINYSFRLIVVINNEEEIIWGF
ncbi:hypothetical protein KTO58_26535 [Chitinophaga pendula]|uniref:hypothetical protein n=1 Tax=Chitinophaga TaxID=79328 RepID=UPI000BAF6A90|nr:MULTISPECIES: hypothetical protein [Chitinophaga]ASZ09880.1 hypothetical protein CK934_02235 [Chitinophaga sp. MD30]UCJ07179.1 hypothetical protein KTO58_26535 [Chitinophaga pendula]